MMPDAITLAMAALGIGAILLAARLAYEYGQDQGYVAGYRAGREVTEARHAERDPMVRARRGRAIVDDDRAPGEWTEEYGK